jgi:hypothetical protein
MKMKLDNGCHAVKTRRYLVFLDVPVVPTTIRNAQLIRLCRSEVGIRIIGASDTQIGDTAVPACVRARSRSNGVL